MSESTAAPMQLCVFTRAWRASGAGLFAQELVLGLLERGASVTFIAPPTESPRIETAQPGLIRWRQTRERGAGASRPARIAASLARIAGGAILLARARRRNRIFVVSIPDPLVFAVPMLLLLRLSGARVIFVAHDPVPHAWKLPAPLRWLEMAAHGACYRLAATVVVLSEASREKLRSAFPTLRSPVAVIDHGVFMLDHPTPLPGAGQLLLFGTIRRNKGVAEAILGTIAAHARDPGVRLVVAGAPHPEDRDYCAECEALAARAPGCVDMRVGYVDDAALHRLFADSDALLLPYTSFFSQSGVAMLAASNARPVIATRAGGLDDLIAEGMPCATIFTPVTAEGVADAIARFRAEPAAVWRTRADTYRAFTLAERSWPVIARRYLDLAARLGG